MQKIKIRLPATLTNFGPSLDSLGLAIGLYTHVDISPRSDDKIIVETDGEGSGFYALGLTHPVVLGMGRFFQQLEKTQVGVHIKIKNEIPIGCGLGAETAFRVAGIIGANNLMGNLYRREQLIGLSAQLCDHADGAVASFVGGLATSLDLNETSIYRSIPIQPFHMIVAIPEIENGTEQQLPERVSIDQLQTNLRQTSFLLHALSMGDLNLLSKVVNDPIQQPLIQSAISGFAHVAEVARLAGALGVTTTGKGTTMVFFADQHLERIMEVIESAFANLDIKAKVLRVPVDTQGVVISFMQTA